MLITDPPGIDPSSLRDRMSGRVSAPGDIDWNEARQAWNVAVDQRPAAVAIPHSVDDVIAIVEFANERGLRVTAQGTGHNAGAFDTLADTILVKTQEMRGVEIDAEARVARVAAGTLWIEVTEPASALGLAPLAGSSPDVGVVGYSPRRRRVVARPQVRPLLQQRRRDRARDRRRRARPRRRRAPRRPLLGAARRRRQLRRRHPHGDPPLPAGRGLRRDDVLAVGAQRRGPQGLGRVDADRARRGHHQRAPDADPAAAGHPGVPPGPRPDRDRRRLRRRRGLRRRAAAAAARPRARDGHVRDDAAGRPVADPHGPRGPDARHRRRRPDARRAHRRGDRRVRRRGRPGLRQRAADERAPPPRRRPRPRARGPRRARALRRRVHDVRRRHPRDARRSPRRSTSASRRWPTRWRRGTPARPTSTSSRSRSTPRSSTPPTRTRACAASRPRSTPRAASAATTRSTPPDAPERVAPQPCFGRVPGRPVRGPLATQEQISCRWRSRS